MSGPKTLTIIARRSPAEARRAIREALAETQGAVREAAILLGVSKPYLWWQMRRLAVPRDLPRRLRDIARARFAPPRGITGGLR